MSDQAHNPKENVDKHSDEILKAYRRTANISTTLFCAVSLLLSLSLFLAGFIFLSYQSWLVSSAISLFLSLFLTMFFTLVVDRAKSQAASRAQSLEISDVKEAVSRVIAESSTSVSRDIALSISQMLEEEATRLVDHWPELLPQDYFPPSEKSNPRFTEKLGHDLSTTSIYKFRGSTGRYLPKFLSEHGRTGLICQILVGDPNDPNALQVSAFNRYAARGGKKPIKDFEADIREETFSTIVQLFDLRERLNIEIRFCNDLLFYRAEIVDAGAYISFYSGNKMDIYPPTYFYTKNKGIFYYNAFQRDFQLGWDHSRGFSIKVGMEQEDLEKFLVGFGAADKLSITKRIEEWRKRQEETS